MPTADPLACNNDGLECFAAGNPTAAFPVAQAFKDCLKGGESGLLVGKSRWAERCYRLPSAAMSCDYDTVLQNLGFLLLWRGEQQGVNWHGRRFEGELFEGEWRGDP